MILALAFSILLQASEPKPIQLPADYREWVFLSSGLGMNYNTTTVSAHPIFDNVFVKRDSYRKFLKTGTWPDGTMFVLEIRASSNEGSINKAGSFQTTIGAREGEKKENGVWTFYGFGTGTEGKPFPRSQNCYQCHAEHAAVDNTFVQFYPTLAPIAKEKGTYKDR